MLEEMDFEKWDPKKGGGNGNGITFLRFERDQTYRVRPIGNALKFSKFFIGKGKPSMIVGAKEKNAAAKMLSEHTGNEMRPGSRFAMFIIDRADGKVKILEAGVTIMEAFSCWAKPMKIKIGSPEGVDWQIAVSGDGLNRKYVATPLNPTVFTDEERTMVNELKAEDKLKLSNYLKETPLDSLLEKAFGDGEAETPAPQPATTGGDDMNW